MSGVREEMMDEDGYPTEETLTTVATWRGDFPVLMDYLRLAWHFGEWYWTEEATERGRRYSISTAGWSGNESLIAAMQGQRFVLVDVLAGAPTWRSLRVRDQERAGRRCRGG